MTEMHSDVYGVAPRPAQAATKPKPGRTGYLLAALLLVAAIGAGIWGGMNITTFIGDIGAISRVIVPGRGEFTLEQPGRYVISHEYRSTVGNRTFSGPDEIRSLTCRVVQKPSGQEVTITPINASVTYQVGSRAGRNIWEFQAEQSGVYELSASYSNSADTGREIVLAIGKGFPWKPFAAIFAGIALAGICGIAALVIFIVTLLRRRRGQPPAAAPPWSTDSP